ncbi:transmembrane ascorbate-dependent reductase CYB561 isoform X2 [Eublepharis macularius]|nr:transmembrane ascorbate-dependent reductase CYB561 isoform X2 [Eublepharis macularius]
MEDLAAPAASSMGFTYMVAASQTLGLAVILMTGAWMGVYRGGIAWENSNLQLNVHPLCMIVGMVFLQGDALLVYRIFRNESKRSTKILHGFLHALALVIALVGLIAVFEYHKKKGYSNMYSLHSWCGIAAFSFYLLQLLCECREGVAGLGNPSSTNNVALRLLQSALIRKRAAVSEWLLGLVFFLCPGVSFSLRSRYKPLHVFFGVSLLILSITTTLLGILEMLLFKISDSYSSFVPEGVLANILGLLLVAFGAALAYILTRDEWRRSPLAEELALSMDFKTLTEGESPAGSH